MATLTLDLPDALAAALAEHVAQKAGATTQGTINAAIALWLLQDGQQGHELKRIYLDAAFPYLNGRSGTDAA